MITFGAFGVISMKSLIETLIEHDRFLIHGRDLGLSDRQSVDTLAVLAKWADDELIEFSWDGARSALTLLADDAARVEADRATAHLTIQGEPALSGSIADFLRAAPRGKGGIKWLHQFRDGQTYYSSAPGKDA